VASIYDHVNTSLTVFVEDLARREKFRLDWTKWAKGEPDSNGVVLRGWPLQCAPTTLSNIRTADEMKTILEAVIRGDFFFELVGNQDNKEDHAGAWNSELTPPNTRHLGAFVSNLCDHSSLRARRVHRAV
jgi:hypothetical protein